MVVAPKTLVLGLAGFQALDAVACAIPLRVIENDLDRLAVPKPLQRAIPVVKGVSAAGLVVGLKRPRLGELTAAALVAYFTAALGFHARRGDGPLRYVPAAALMAWVAMTLRAYRPSSGT